MPHAPTFRKTVLAAPIPTDLDHAVRVLAAVERKKLCHVMEAALHRYVDERRDLLSAPAVLCAADASSDSPLRSTGLLCGSGPRLNEVEAASVPPTPTPASSIRSVD
ncbi:MAG: hypothetical protein P4L85_05235 [Paludisphaera borealis]|uniref:hypothetical protein n=1 Tax=Paludisphaera borealis TaxID=1387353 RepID=UPI00283BFF40|nr:hypothetical protein [Paludisphaera borealis]MDR3618735.1 hypothetical protein [Paludisphaera borealis]